MPYYLDCQLSEKMVLVVGKGLRRSHYNAFSGMDSQRVEVFHIADRDTVVKPVADYFIFYFLPSLQRFFNQNLWGEGKCLCSKFLQFRVIVAESAAQAAQGVGCANDYRIAQLVCRLEGIFYVLNRVALYGLYGYLVELFDKQFSVFCVHNGLNRSSKNLYAILFQYSLAVEFHAAVKGSLASERKQYSLRLFFLDYFLHKIGGYRQEVDLVRNSFRCLHRGDVRVYEHGLYVLFFHRLEGLGTRIVEFSGFTDLQCAGTQYQDFLYGFCSLHLQEFYELVKQEFRIGRAACGLRVELGGEERLLLVADAFICAVVHVHKQRLPVFVQG